MGICAGRECNLFYTPDSEEQLRTKMLKEYLKCRQQEIQKELDLIEEDTLSSKQDSPKQPPTPFTDSTFTSPISYKPPNNPPPPDNFQHLKPPEAKIKERRTYDSLPPPEMFTFQSDSSKRSNRYEIYENKDQKKVQLDSETNSDRSSIDKGYGLRYDIKRYTQFPSPTFDSQRSLDEAEFEEVYDPVRKQEKDKKQKELSSMQYEEVIHISPERGESPVIYDQHYHEDEFDENSEVEEETKLPARSNTHEIYDYEEYENREMLQRLKERRSHHILRIHERPKSPDLQRIETVSHLVDWIYQEERLSKAERSSYNSSSLNNTGSRLVSPSKY
jgi:hypothetical protein